MTPVNTGEIEQRVHELGPWFHNLDLNGVKTAPEHFLGDYPAIKWRTFSHAIPSDLRGRTVLDIGCNAGFYSMEMKRRGAERVVGIDYDESYLAQARFAAEVSGMDIEFRRMSVYDVGSLGEKFDLVLFMGVLYHLRHPLLALDLLHEHVARDLLVFQSMLRGSAETGQFNRDYPFSDATFSTTHGFRGCTLSSTITRTTTRTGGFRIEPARRPCCVARGSKSSIIPRRKCSSASAGGRANDGSGDALERAE